MAPGVADHLAPGAGMEVQGDLIAHRAGGDEDRRLHTHGRRGLLLQAIDGRILAEDVVPHLGLGHGPAHLRVGLGHRIGTQIDQIHENSPYFPNPIPTRTAAWKASPHSASMWILGTSRLIVTPPKITGWVVVSLSERRLESSVPLLLTKPKTTEGVTAGTPLETRGSAPYWSSR